MKIASCRDFDRALEHEGGGEEAGPGQPAHLRLGLEQHARGCPRCAGELQQWREISRAARTLHRRWDSPDLWARIQQTLESQAGPAPAPTALAAPAPRAPAPLAAAATASAHAGWRRWLPAGGWRARWWLPVAAATAVAALVVVPAALLLGSRPSGPDALTTGAVDLASTTDPLLTERAVDEVENAEQQYRQAIERLSRVARPALNGASASSPLGRSLREKLNLIDSAIAELQAGIDSNRRNTHLRRELLTIYQEKQQTLRDLMALGQPDQPSGYQNVAGAGLTGQR